MLTAAVNVSLCVCCYNVALTLNVAPMVNNEAKLDRIIDLPVADPNESDDWRV